MLRIKLGVVIACLQTPNMFYPVEVADHVWHTRGWGHVTITASLEGTHMADGFHYKGLAFDIRFPMWPNWTLPTNGLAVVDLEQRLPDFDIVLERTHIHIEPKPGKGLDIFKTTG